MLLLACTAAPSNPSSTSAAPPDEEVPPSVRGCGWHLTTGTIPEGAAPLVAAVMEGNVTTVTVMLRAGSPPDVHDPHLDTTPLLAAVEANCEEIVARLLDAGASPSFPSNPARTALTIAVNVGNPPVVEMLLLAGADPSEGGWDMPSALHEAVGIPRISILEAMIPFASDLDVGQMSELPLASGEDLGLGSPVEFAADVGCVGCVDILVGGGATPTATAVYRGVRACDEEIVARLVELGAPLGAPGSEERRLMVDYADSIGCTEVATFIEGSAG
jgi:hypothetical protein